MKKVKIEKEALTKRIKDVFDHELHHLFNAAIKFNKKSKTSMLNSIYKQIKQPYLNRI